MSNSSKIQETLNRLLGAPNLSNARQLEKVLREANLGQKLLGRANQKSSVDAASESDRGFIERLANAFDASLTAARVAAKVPSNKSLTPRACAERFLCPTTEDASWNPTVEQENFKMPMVQVWLESEDQKNRFRKFNPNDGLATILVRDYGIGLPQTDMPSTILALNSESKLKTFEAIGQFGHGGSSALSFCESCLILTQPRFSKDASKFFWTLIISEKEQEQSKQQLVRKWYCDGEGLPLSALCKDYSALAGAFPGTSVYHFGYNRGGWINRVAGPSQTAPWGRLGRLMFSYPLPFELVGEIARTDTATGKRTIDGAFFRLVKQSKPDKEVEYYSGQMSESLIVEGQNFGSFYVFIFALSDKSKVANYVDPQHPIILTLNGQNHGELTRTIFGDTNIAELASSCIIEVRLDGLEDEALNEIVSNSREMPKNSVFTRALKERLKKVIASDEMLGALEEQRQLEKASKSSSDLSAKISKMLSSMLSDAVAEPTTLAGGTAPGGSNKQQAHCRPSKREVPAADPPHILEFIADELSIPEGSTVFAKFRSDARPPKYCFQGDNPRCFALLELSSHALRAVKITGRREISPNGYGQVTLYCPENKSEPVTESSDAGKLVLKIQSTDGTLLQAELPVKIVPRPPERARKRRFDIRPEIVFVAPDEADLEELKSLFFENNLLLFSKASLLPRYSDALNIDPSNTSYWAAKTESHGESILSIEINAANPALMKLLNSCHSAEERIEMKERYVRDIALDCYQHCFHLEELPEEISEVVFTEPDDAKRAAEIHLNHQKAIHIAYVERTVTKQPALR